MQNLLGKAREILFREIKDFNITIPSFWPILNAVDEIILVIKQKYEYMKMIKSINNMFSILIF